MAITCATDSYEYRKLAAISMHFYIQKRQLLLLAWIQVQILGVFQLQHTNSQCLSTINAP